ncbi:MAG: alpha-glucosidase, partial [Lysobacterales bacterium]
MLKSLVCCCLLFSLPLHGAWLGQLDSPDGQLGARIGLDGEGRLWFQVLRLGEAVIEPSPLGVSLHNTGFERDLAFESVSAVEPVTDAYRMWVGKQKQVEYRANRLDLAVRNTAGHSLVVALRLSNDGLAWRYEFPGESEDTRVVVAERSGVHFPAETRAWLQPKAEAQSGWMNTNPSYEEDYLQDIPV